MGGRDHGIGRSEILHLGVAFGIMELNDKLFLSKQDFQRVKRMKRTLTHKILESHLAEGTMHADAEIAVRIDHTLLQDATGTLAMLEFEALGLDRVRVELAAQYVDHNLLQTDSKNADDHRFLQTASARYGIHFSRPGNGVSHQVHMERFGVPGKTLLGADSHTPGAAGVSMLGMGAGGLDVALAMAGYPYFLPCPKVFGVRLIGKLPAWVSAKDFILEMLRRRGVGGCVGMIIEYYGPRSQDTFSDGPRDRRQHGHGNGCNKLHFSVR